MGTIVHTQQELDAALAGCAGDNTSGPINRVLSAVAAEIRTASTAAEDGPS